MLEPWNNKTILPPPVQTCLIVVKNCEKDSRTLKRVCNNALNILSKQSPLHREAALLSRFLYKYDKKFRNDIGYRTFKKINTTLRRYLALNIINDIKNFEIILPDDYENDQALPTRQMIEYVLLRLVTLSKLMLRVSVCCKRAAIFYLDRVKRGDSYWMSLVPYALLSRIWSLSNILLHHSCSWYLQMYPYVGKLQLKGLPFLPDGYELPVNLEEWLDLKNHEEFGQFQWSQKNKHINPNIREDDETNTMDSLIMYINEINKDNDEMDTKLQPRPDVINESTRDTVEKYVDKGEAICRESFNKFFAQPQDKVNLKKNIYFHSIDRVTNAKTLVEFVTKEDTLRYDKSTMSLTNQMSFMQWQALKTSLLNLCDSLSNNRKIQKKFLKIWKEKCVDSN